ncbi:hypothetical protein HWV23_02750 [Natronomonas halophila]|uniref:hypothetical protein n=1 Tax=Natronomonas halophila TaxID=2747817 RepID=UPI0015B760AB|nr:hypothetical protein [Natronomonas halophila]QLD84621.1 hypothetical protein HWV23_02475 [Natronomonas halophila]QLD84675.1 hypothetical protein HWV23_02750 [Natronomonas halophila]
MNPIKRLKEEARAFSAGTRGQGTNLAGLFIGLLIAAIIAVEVFIPVVLESVNSSNASGTTLTILELLPMFAGLLLLIALASPLMRRI